MTEKEEKYIKAWEKTVAKGKKFHLIRTALIFGIVASILTPFMEYLLTLFDDETMVFDKDFLIRMGFKFILFNLLGLYLGNSSWKNGNKKYKQLISNKNE